MYKIYLTTGVLLLLAGIITTICLLWFLKNAKLKSEKSIILFLAHAIATAFIGIFYIYSALIMLNNNNDNNNLQQIPLYNLFDYGQYFNLTEFNIDDLSITTEKNGFGEAQPIPDEYIEAVLNMSDLDEAGTEIPNASSTTEALNYTQKINSEDPAQQFLLKYQQLLKDALNKTSYEVPVLNRRKERTVDYKETQQDSENLYNNTMCSFQNIFLQHVMLTYSFVHGLVALINSAIDCKDCMEHKEDNDNQEKPSTSDEDSNITQEIENSGSEPNILTKIKAENSKPSQKHQKLILQLLTILIPPLCASSLCFIMQNQENAPTTLTNHHITKILQNPTNISSLQNTNQVNNVVKNIYQIIREVKANSNLIIPKLNYFGNLNITSETTRNYCYNPSMFLKIHTFLIFIVGYFIVLLYSQTAYAKLRLNRDPMNARNLKMVLLSFGTLWLPAALEMFSRIYLFKDLPNLVAELLTALGNFSHILMNIGSVLMTKKVVKKQNYVQPVV